MVQNFFLRSTTTKRWLSASGNFNKHKSKKFTFLFESRYQNIRSATSGLFKYFLNSKISYFLTILGVEKKVFARLERPLTFYNPSFATILAYF